jgi:hypothetical protein
MGLASALALGGVTAVAMSTAGAQTDDQQTQEGPREGCHRGPKSLDAAAEALNLTEDELRSRLEDGETTIAEVAAAQGVDVQTVIDAMVADATAHIDQKVADGDLSAERAAEIKANLEERITTRVNEGRPDTGDHHQDAGENDSQDGGQEQDSASS